MIPKGQLLIIGGKEDRHGNKPEMEEKNNDFSPNEILKLLVKSKSDRIEVITVATSDPDDAKETYTKTFEKIGYTNFDFLDLNDDHCHTDYHLKRVKAAKAIFFTGGDQNKICESLQQSVLVDILKKKYIEDENFMIAGTSAGAMCLPEIVICDAVNGEAMLDHDIEFGTGLQLINNCIVDTHFVHRGRFGRLAHATILHRQHWGIGLGEDTALLIENGCKATCKGSGMVVMINAKDIKHTNINSVKKGDPIYAENLKVNLLTDGCSVNLNNGEMRSYGN
ncbi:cyanophycinase [Chryseobacterium sp. CBSDS_008]|uniref:cyanophycinase n=1 Tax=Chryseobacterium sp. CBSDS_008 TaxID=3415265 RepID=UPI003CEF543D